MMVKWLGRSVTMRIRRSRTRSKKRQVVAFSRVWVSRFIIRLWEATGSCIARIAAAIRTGTKGLHRSRLRVRTQAAAMEKKVSMGMTRRADDGYWARPHT